MDEVNRGGEEDRSTCDTDVIVGTVSQAENSVILEEYVDACPPPHEYVSQP